MYTIYGRSQRQLTIGATKEQVQSNREIRVALVALNVSRCLEKGASTRRAKQERRDTRCGQPAVNRMCGARGIGLKYIGRSLCGSFGLILLQESTFLHPCKQVGAGGSFHTAPATVVQLSAITLRTWPISRPRRANIMASPK
jgi:hypothetical protein